MRVKVFKSFVFSFLLVLPFFFAREAGTTVELRHPRGDGVLSLYTVHLKEEVTVQYRAGGNQYIDDGVEALNHLLRSRSDQKETQMALALFELVDHIQDHFGVKTIHVVSGYRSPELNAQLRSQGRRVASRSRHMFGQAMDIRLPGISARTVRDYLLSLKIGGVGYYGANNFVHVDVGPFRTW